MWYDKLNVETTDDILWRISKIESSTSGIFFISEKKTSTSSIDEKLAFVPMFRFEIMYLPVNALSLIE